MIFEKEIEEFGHFLTELKRESDRGAALIAAAVLDERLKEILENYLIVSKEANALLSGANAPLGTLSARASISYSLGLIQKNEFEEITLIRKIRNEFGHQWKNVDFNNKKIISYCNKLPWLGPAESEIGSTSRARFDFAVAILLTNLLWRARLVKTERRKQRIWSNRS